MYRIQGATHKGQVRQHNEDRYAGSMLGDGYGYALVCDGMGGESGGGIASTLACGEIRRTLDGSYRPEMDEKSVYMILETAIANANAAVYAKASGDSSLTGMGTTASLAVLCDGSCFLANVGDSRVYLLHGDKLTQLTVDHTHVQTLIDQGEITPEEAKSHPQRHYLTKAVGVMPYVTPYFYQEKLAEGDLLLLCSDGLHSLVEGEVMASLLRRIATGEDCQILIDEANRLGGNDNITAVAVITNQGGQR